MTVNIFILGKKSSFTLSQPRLLLSNQRTSTLLTVKVKFVVGSCLAPRVFLGVLRFSFIHRTRHLQIPIRPG